MSNERKGGLYIDLLMTVRYSHEAWEGHVCSVNSHEAWKGHVCSANSHEGRVVSIHSEQTQSHLLEKTHQSNCNLRKNDSVLMPKGEFKLAPNLVGVFIPFKSLVPIRCGT